LRDEEKKLRRGGGRCDYMYIYNSREESRALIFRAWMGSPFSQFNTKEKERGFIVEITCHI
jgi:hypothetical protein